MVMSKGEVLGGMFWSLLRRSQKVTTRDFQLVLASEFPTITGIASGHTSEQT